MRGDLRSIVLEVLDAAGSPAGALDGFGTGVEVPPGREIVVSSGLLANLTEWSFDWTAPASGTGPVAVHLAGVDGDGGRSGDLGDPLGDDVDVQTLRFGELGASQGPP